MAVLADGEEHCGDSAYQARASRVDVVRRKTRSVLNFLGREGQGQASEDGGQSWRQASSRQPKGAAAAEFRRWRHQLDLSVKERLAECCEQIQADLWRESQTLREHVVQLLEEAEAAGTENEQLQHRPSSAAAAGSKKVSFVGFMSGGSQLFSHSEEDTPRVPSSESPPLALTAEPWGEPAPGPTASTASFQGIRSWHHEHWDHVAKHKSRLSEQIQKSWVYRLVKSQAFESACAIVILLNCASMGVEAHQVFTHALGSDVNWYLAVSEQLFALFFVVEFMIRLRVLGCKAFRPTSGGGRMNLLDAILVVFDCIIFTWLMPLLALLTGKSNEAGFMRLLTVLRAARLMRLLRVFRGTPWLRDARLLIQGLADSSRTLLWIVLVIFMVTYTWAIFGVALVGELEEALDAASGTGNAEDVAILKDLLGMTAGIDKMMYTLIQVLTQDSFHPFMRQILVFVPWSWVYFYTYIIVGCLILMNLVTAIVVENAMETSRNDHEQKMHDKEQLQKDHVRELECLFSMMDSDGNGTISWDEFRASFENVDLRRRWMMLDFSPEDCWELFQMLDVQNNGQIDTGSFFSSLTRMKGAAQSKDLFRLTRSVAELEALVRGSGAAPAGAAEPGAPRSGGALDAASAPACKDCLVGATAAAGTVQKCLV